MREKLLEACRAACGRLACMRARLQPPQACSAATAVGSHRSTHMMAPRRCVRVLPRCIHRLHCPASRCWCAGAADGHRHGKGELSARMDWQAARGGDMGRQRSAPACANSAPSHASACAAGRRGAGAHSARHRPLLLPHGPRLWEPSTVRRPMPSRQRNCTSGAGCLACPAGGRCWHQHRPPVPRVAGMAPEVITNSRVTIAADLFSMGVLLWCGWLFGA